MSTSTARIYVDLESLFDLRQAALLTLTRDPKTLAQYLNSEAYNYRQSDTFPEVDPTEYRQVYQGKNMALWSKSTITHILTLLQTKITNLEKRNTFYNEKKIPEVVFNTYPLTLTDAQQEQIQNLLFVKLGGNCLVTLVHLPVQELTPYYFSHSGYVSCFLYNFSDWVNAHGKALESAKMPDLLLYFPSLYHETKDAHKLQEIEKLGFKDLFAYVEYLFASVVSVNFLPVVFYSNAVTASVYLRQFNTTLSQESLLDPEQNREVEQLLSRTPFSVKE